MKTKLRKLRRQKANYCVVADLRIVLNLTPFRPLPIQCNCYRQATMFLSTIKANPIQAEKFFYFPYIGEYTYLCPLCYLQWREKLDYSTQNFRSYKLEEKENIKINIKIAIFKHHREALCRLCNQTSDYKIITGQIHNSHECFEMLRYNNRYYPLYYCLKCVKTFIQLNRRNTIFL